MDVGNYECILKQNLWALLQNSTFLPPFIKESAWENSTTIDFFKKWPETNTVELKVICKEGGVLNVDQMDWWSRNFTIQMTHLLHPLLVNKLWWFLSWLRIISMVSGNAYSLQSKGCRLFHGKMAKSVFFLNKYWTNCSDHLVIPFQKIKFE